MNIEFQNLVIDKLLNIMGLSIIQDYIYDEDKCGFLIYDEGRIKVNRNGIFHNNDKEFSPLFDIKQMEYFFTAYTAKEAEDNGLYIQSTGVNSMFNTAIVTSKKCSPLKYQLHIDTNEGSIDTNYYYNLCLCYIEAIFRLANIFNWDMNLANWLRATDYSDEDMLIKLESSGKGR